MARAIKHSIKRSKSPKKHHSLRLVKKSKAKKSPVKKSPKKSIRKYRCH